MRTETGRRYLEIAPQSATDTQVYAVRGNLIVSSLESLRQFNHYERYLDVLEPTWREQVVFCLASSWVPVEVAMAHYAAHDALMLSASELIDLSEWVSERVAGSFLGSLLRGSRTQGLGLCPWVPLREYRRMCERLLQGGLVAMKPTGEREAVLEISGVPMMRYVTFRQTMLALTRHAVGAFVNRAIVREDAAEIDQFRIMVRWI